MSRKSELLKLPKETLEKLKSNYLNNTAWTVDDHHAWLIDFGYKGSRTAVWRYLKEIDKAELATTSSLHEFSKLLCLDVASKYANNKNELLTLSKDLLKWIKEEN